MEKTYEFAEKNSRQRILIIADTEEDARRDLPECEYDLIDVFFAERGDCVVHIMPQ